jgi:crotonobetainyl-CoA:carnitine CoA-transferase CaiB-like acyl-CoA transferase
MRLASRPHSRQTSPNPIKEALKDLANPPFYQESLIAEMLTGLKIVEYATYVAAPGAGGLLADWGATVIKVEPPGGDPIRQFFASVGVESAVNPVFDLDNRGKRSIVLDTAKPEGRRVLERLVARADVFLTNVRPGGLKRGGLDYETLARLNPRLVYASLTGYGLEGPDADKPGMDTAAFWARSGLAAMFTPRGAEPVQIRTAFGDHVASMAAAAGILAALYERERSGRGRLVEASLIRAAHYAGGSDFAIQHALGRMASNKARARAPNPLINYFKTADDRWLCLITRQGARDWAPLCTALGKVELVDDERFARAKTRRENGEALVALLDESFGAMTMAEAGAALDRADIIWAPVQTPAEAIKDPQALAAGAVVRMPMPDGSFTDAPAGPIRFPGADDGPKGPAPRAGQHTREILTELGYVAAEIDALFAAGAAA